MDVVERKIRDRVFVVLAMRRSGHHAVVNQLCYQIDNVIHLNDCAVRQSEMSAPKGGRFRLYQEGVVFDTGKVRPRDPYKYLRSTFTANLVYSFENGDISIDYSKMVEPHRSYVTICVVRDPFNWLASSLQRGPDKPAHSELGINLWKKQVQQCLHPETYPFGDFVGINFNRWFLNREYRAQLSDRLGLKYSEQGLNEVPRFGVGSSFDGTSFQGNGSKMKVLERYKYFENDERYRSFFKDRELIALSEQYFELNPWFYR